MEFDPEIEMGEFGPYHKQMYFLASAPVLLVAFETMSVIFTFYIPPHRCAVPGYAGDTYAIQNDSHALSVNASIPMTGGTWDRCHVYDNFSVTNATARASSGAANQRACHEWVYDQSTFHSTIATSFNVVCGRTIQRPTSNTLQELGAFVGVFVSGFIAQRFGRKITFYIASLGLISGGIGLTHTQSMPAVNVCRFTLGMIRMVMWTNSLIIGNEIVGSTRRTFAVRCIEVLWSVGGILVLLFFYGTRTWRFIGIAISVPCLSLLVYWWLLPESPRCLASRGRKAEAVKVLDKAPESNNAHLLKEDISADLVTSDKTVGFSHLCRSGELTKRKQIFLINMFVVVLLYHGITLNITNLNGDIFVNFAINAVMETLAYFTPYFVHDRLGHKPMYCGSLILAGFLCVISVAPALVGNGGVTVIVLSTLSRFFVSTAFATIVSEPFPTPIRSSAYGMALISCRVANLVVPFVTDIGILVGGKLQDALPLIVMGTPAVLVGVLSLWLPEAFGNPEPIEELDVTVVAPDIRLQRVGAKGRELEVTSASKRVTISTPDTLFYSEYHNQL